MKVDINKISGKTSGKKSARAQTASTPCWWSPSASARRCSGPSPSASDCCHRGAWTRRWRRPPRGPRPRRLRRPPSRSCRTWSSCWTRCWRRCPSWTSRRRSSTPTPSAAATPGSASSCTRACSGSGSARRSRRAP